MTEREVTKQIIGFLEGRGWRCLRMHSGLFKHATPGYKGRVRVGEVGMCDWLCVDYRRPAVFWLELKRPGLQLRASQADWMSREEGARGALICVADSLESFETWYGGMYW